MIDFGEWVDEEKVIFGVLDMFDSDGWLED